MYLYLDIYCINNNIFRSWSFDCPSCQDVCTCRACKRKRQRNSAKSQQGNKIKSKIKTKQEL